MTQIFKDKSSVRATLKDVARQAGTSQMAASVVLNGSRSSASVSEATRQRIMTAARELDYQPNAIARSLKSRSTNIIGFYSGYGMLSTWSAFLTEILRGLHAGCNANEKDLLVHGIFHQRPVEDIYAELTVGKIDGLCLLTYPDDPLVGMLMQSSLPAVMVTDAAPGLPSVVVDDAAGGRLLAEHLAERGHRRVIYRAFRRESLVSVNRRLTAFQEAAAQAGMSVLVSEPVENTFRWTPEEEAAMALPSGERPTAIACWYDGIAHDTLKLCRMSGLRVPEDVAVTGFDGISVTPEPADIVTTIRAPWFDVAKTALSLIVARIDGQSIPPETTLPVELKVGNTT